MTVIQAQLLMGLAITVAMLLVPITIDIFDFFQAKRAEKRALAECNALWLAMDQDLYGNDPVDVDIDFDELVDTCEFDHNRQG
jgi:hypothetical protein